MHALRSAAPSAIAAVLTFVLAACGTAPGGSAGPSGSPGGSPTASPTAGGDTIDHATGATDVVLRLEEGGGFVAPSFFLTQGPLFTLYGDGTVIARDPSIRPPVDPNGINLNGPYRTLRLDENGVQALLRFAVGEGGLGIARNQYDPGNIADAGTSTFTLDAGGVVKTVAVVALGLGAYESSSDRAIVTAMTALRDRLVAFATAVGGGPWVPDRYRGMLTDAGGFGPAKAWPWKGVTPADFTTPPDGSFAMWRTMTTAEAEALAIPSFEGGIFEIDLKLADGTTVAFHLRPLWPDEAR